MGSHKMGVCGAFLRWTGYIGIVLVAVLLYFHLECIKEREVEHRTKTNDVYEPEKTNCEVPLNYSPKGLETEIWLGMEWIFQQSMPCSITKLTSYISHLTGSSNLDAFLKEEKGSTHNVTILDARKVSPGSFHETGFTMVTLDKEPVTTDWRATFQFNDKPDIMHFHKQMEPYIMELYPETKKIWWTYNVVRGGDKFGDQPRAVGGPHLDYHQDDQARLEFHKEFPELDSERSEPKILMGKMNQDGLEMKVLLGVWKPLYPAKICDYPLALMDARTFKPENLAKNKIHINFMPGVTFHNLNGAISFDEEQKWYYYSNQNPMEVLIFHQYSKGKWFSNPHTSFLNKNCPKDSGERISVELRVGLFF